MSRGYARPAYRHLSDFVKGRNIGMRDMGASYWQIAQTVGCSAMISKRVVRRWTQDNGMASRAGTGPSRWTTPREDHMSLRLDLTNRRITGEILAEVTGRVSPWALETDYWKLGCYIELPWVFYHRHHTTGNRDFHGIEAESTGILNGILWCSAMSLASVCGSEMDANVFVDDLVKGHRKQWLLSRHISLQLLESCCVELFDMTTGRNWYLLKGNWMLASMWQEW